MEVMTNFMPSAATIEEVEILGDGVSLQTLDASRPGCVNPPKP
jgi:hypothetical protein